MNLGLEGKRALVTAASGGLGYATAKALALEGAHVLICSREQSRADEAAARISSEASTQVQALACDVADDVQLKNLFGKIDSHLGGLDILVCNAGGPPSGDFKKLDASAWDTAYQLTLLSVVRSVSYALPYFQQAGGGCILSIASSSIKRPLANLLLSNVFRPAIAGLTKSLSVELASDNIRVNCLAPGRIETERVNQLDQLAAERQGLSVDEVRKRSLGGIPMGRLGQPDEFGRVAAFLCSEVASYMTGSILYADGGSVTCL